LYYKPKFPKYACYTHLTNCEAFIEEQSQQA